MQRITYMINPFVFDVYTRKQKGVAHVKIFFNVICLYVSLFIKDHLLAVVQRKLRIQQ